jgi:hypothetical protein
MTLAVWYRRHVDPFDCSRNSSFAPRLSIELGAATHFVARNQDIAWSQCM